MSNRAESAGLDAQSSLCECGHFLSSHTKNGCTYRPDCLCVGFITPAQRREQDDPTLETDGWPKRWAPSEFAAVAREVLGRLDQRTEDEIDAEIVRERDANDTGERLTISDLAGQVLREPPEAGRLDQESRR